MIYRPEPGGSEVIYPRDRIWPAVSVPLVRALVDVVRQVRWSSLFLLYLT
jgi:hypothetical protein